MSCLLCSLKLRLTMLATIAVQDAHDETSLYTLIALSRYQLHVHHWVMLIQSNALNSPHHLCHHQSHAHEPAKINSLIKKVLGKDEPDESQLKLPITVPPKNVKKSPQKIRLQKHSRKVYSLTSAEVSNFCSPHYFFQRDVCICRLHLSSGLSSTQPDIYENNVWKKVRMGMLSMFPQCNIEPQFQEVPKKNLIHYH